MSFFKRIWAVVGLLFYLAIGSFFVALSIRAIEPMLISDYLFKAYENPDILIALRILGIVLVLKGVIFLKYYFSANPEEKIITFDNPDGQVVVSLSAVEEYINKIVKNMKQVKELKAVVLSSKKGLEVRAKAIIVSDANVPAITEQLQQVIKEKVIEMLGIEDSVVVKIHVSKVVQTEGNQGKGITEQEHIPYAE